ncbi:hypothetical protein JL721_12790 [Aureococcus anophagefferens]|nr:hypothetical protein JL721_12790 [Aureococcus anophagefferens]
MAGDGLQVCKGATKSLTTLYELHTDLAYEYVGGTRVALDSCLGSAELRDTRYVCGVALSAFSELRVETERRAIRTYARVRDGASDALAELYRMALRASGVTRYGRTQLARAKSYAALTKDVIDFSFDAVSTAAWALFDKAGDLATAMFSSKTVASLLDDVDLSATADAAGAAAAAALDVADDAASAWRRLPRVHLADVT